MCGTCLVLLQPHTHWPGASAESVWMFQLPLIAALYIDSTRQAGHGSATFAKLLKLTNIPYITINTWGWSDAYDYTKLAGYLYMALFKEPLYHGSIPHSPFQDIGYVITQTIEHCSEIRLSALCLLDASAKYLHATASASIYSDRNHPDIFLGILSLNCTFPTGFIAHRIYELEPFNPWVVFHLDTLFPQSTVLKPEEFDQLEWTDTPEQVHIAKARLALYESFEEGTKRLRPDPQVLRMFLWSKDDVVCTGAFKWCLNLVTTSQPNGAGVFIPETEGYGWIEHLIQVLFGYPGYQRGISWKFLVENLVPKWTMLPPFWCSGFAYAFLFSNMYYPGMAELHAYQSFAKPLINGEIPFQVGQLFLPFFITMVELTKSGMTWGQLTSIENWLAQIPQILENRDAHAQTENI